MTRLNVYLNFAGNTEEALTFYRGILGGDFSSLMRYGDMPMEGVAIAQQDLSKIMHVALPVGEHDVLMASDALESMGQHLNQGNNVYLFVQPDSKAEADRIFTALAAGGVVEMPIADQPWGDYWGSLQDKFGVLWMVNYSYPST